MNKLFMKKPILMFIAVTMLLAVSCEKNNNDWQTPDVPTDPDGGGGGMNPGGQGGDGSADLGELTSFDVSIDKSALTETETIPTDNDDYVENNQADFSNTIYICYKDNSVTVTGDTDGEVSLNGADVTVNAQKANIYVLSGTTSDGRFKLYSEKKSQVRLNGVSITNNDGAAINIQTKKRTYLIVCDGTENTLRDGTSYVTEYESDSTEEKQKGTYYSKSQTIISGSGQLNVYANCRNGIAVKDYLRIRKNTNIYVCCTSSEGHCVKCENSTEGEGIIIEGGVLNLENSASGGKGISSDGEITINGGRLTAICTGNGLYDTESQESTGAACIKSDGIFTLNSGELHLKATGTGGKGINGDTDMHFNGGSAYIVTTGTAYTYSTMGNQGGQSGMGPGGGGGMPGGDSSSNGTKPKGIKCDSTIFLSGTNLMVRTTGTQEGSEGIESKTNIQMSAGDVKIYAADDAMNATTDITIAGGTLYAYATNNDGVDSNGTMTISGGTAYAFGTTQPEEGFDCDQNRFTITGGTIFGIGGTTSTPTSSVCKQPSVIITSQSVTAGSNYTLASQDGSTLLSISMPRTYSGATILLSHPSFAVGSTYTWGSKSFTLTSMVSR